VAVRFICFVNLQCIRSEQLRSMKKNLLLLSIIILLNGCAESMALLAPASTALGKGNVVQSSVTSAVNYGIKKQTGKSPVEHAISYAEKNNPTRKQEKCVNFIEKTRSEVCTIALQKISELKVKVKNSYKIKNIDQ